MTSTGSGLPPLTLADPATLGDPGALRAAAAHAEERPDPADRYDGAEETRSVWVAVDPRCLLLSVEVSPTWRLRLAPEHFADAVFGAYTAAVRTALVAEQARRPPHRARPAAPAPVHHGQDFETWLASTREWVTATDERLAGFTATANSFAAAGNDIRDVSGPAGYVTLRLRAGALTGITAATAGLKSANPNVLRQDVLDAFQAAGLRAGH